MYEEMALIGRKPTQQIRYEWLCTPTVGIVQRAGLQTGIDSPNGGQEQGDVHG